MPILKNYDSNKSPEMTIHVNLCLDALAKDVEVSCPYCDHTYFKIRDNIFKWPEKLGGYVYAELTIPNYDNKYKRLTCINCSEYIIIDLGSYSG